MSFRLTLAGAASVALVTAQSALAGSLAPAVDCDVTPNAPECATVVYAPAAPAGGGSGIGGLGTAGTVGVVAGSVLAVGLLAAALDDDDDDNDDASGTTTTILDDLD